MVFILGNAKRKYSNQLGYQSNTKRWVSFFHHLSHQAYEQAADVITLFGRNSAYQKELGAPAHKLKIVPNGVTLSDYKGLRKPKHNSDKLIISAIIRVVPIKDVKQ